MGHLEDVGMSYREHLARSWQLAWEFATLAAKAVVHGLLPDVWTTSSTVGITQTLPRLLGST